MSDSVSNLNSVSTNTVFFNYPARVNLANVLDGINTRVNNLTTSVNSLTTSGSGSGSGSSTSSTNLGTIVMPFMTISQVLDSLTTAPDGADATILCQGSGTFGVDLNIVKKFGAIWYVYGFGNTNVTRVEIYPPPAK
jgi:hypothetical protein